MKTLSIPLLLGVLLVTGPVCAGNISKVNGSISAEPGQRYGKLDTVNGGIRVGEGVETGSIDTVNGGVKVADRAAPARSKRSTAAYAWPRGDRHGGVSTVNGSIFTDRGSQIEGGVETVNSGIGLVESRVGKDVEPSTVTSPSASVRRSTAVCTCASRTSASR
jgi:hypothetical protein